MAIRIFRPSLNLDEEKIPKNTLENLINNSKTELSAYFQLCDDIGDSDYLLLPSIWNYFIDNNKLILAKDVIKLSKIHKKKTIVFCTGDYTANGPFEDCIIIQSSAFKSRSGYNGNDLLAMPTFINDYLRTYCQDKLNFRDYEIKPVVGFCGQSNGTRFDYARRKAHITEMNLRYKLGFLKWEPPNIEPTRFRHNILKTIASCSGVQTNFLMRTKYRAGYRPKIKDPFHTTRLEFVNNIINSDYTLCMRGGGNFSVRFYETLALGRIPIFINTDCILPFDEMINYKDYMVWVEESELPFINQKILDFHNSLNPAKFTELQQACRTLWQTYLTKDGFYLHLADQLRTLIDNAN